VEPVGERASFLHHCLSPQWLQGLNLYLHELSDLISQVKGLADGPVMGMKLAVFGDKQPLNRRFLGDHHLCEANLTDGLGKSFTEDKSIRYRFALKVRKHLVQHVQMETEDNFVIHREVRVLSWQVVGDVKDAAPNVGARVQVGIFNDAWEGDVVTADIDPKVRA